MRRVVFRHEEQEVHGMQPLHHRVAVRMRAPLQHKHLLISTWPTEGGPGAGVSLGVEVEGRAGAGALSGGLLLRNWRNSSIVSLPSWFKSAAGKRWSNCCRRSSPGVVAAA